MRWRRWRGFRVLFGGWEDWRTRSVLSPQDLWFLVGRYLVWTRAITRHVEEMESWDERGFYDLQTLLFLVSGHEGD